MEGKALIMDEKAMSRAINRISYEIIERGKGAEDLCIIGIVSRGVELAQRIADKIKSVSSSGRSPSGRWTSPPTGTTSPGTARRRGSRAFRSRWTANGWCWWTTSSAPAGV